MDWRDLRIALALERHRTLGEAARALGVDPTTVSRRITALEEAVGATLFVRSADGWRATDAGARVVDAAARMAHEVRTLGHDLDQATERVLGTVRLTTVDYIVGWYLAPRLASLRERHPDLVIDFRCTEQILDLASGQADIALRLSRPTEAGLRVRRLLGVPLGLYGARSLVERAGLFPLDPARPADLVINGTPRNRLPETRWAQSLVPRGRVAVATTSLSAAFELVVAGAGLGVLAVAAAEGHPGLIRLDDGRGAPERSLFRVVPEELADAPRIRAVTDWLDGLHPSAAVERSSLGEGALD